MEESNNKEIIIFMLQAVEKLSLAVLTGDFDNREIDEIHQMASIHLFDLEKIRVTDREGGA